MTGAAARTDWRPVRVIGVPDSLILFDGVCVLCSFWVRFVIDRDRAAQFHFAPVQSPIGAELAARLGIDPENPETNAVILDGRAYFKSDAALAVLSHLPRWPWVRLLHIVPRPLRDWCYDCVAGSRYRLFGRTDRCMMPTPDITARFLSENPTASPRSL